MNALDMLGGFTQSAGPIGGADTGSAAGDTVVAPGAFDALVSQALEGSSSDVALDADDPDDETDPADSGVDLAFLIAMGGMSLPLTTPVAVDTAVPSTAATTIGTGSMDGTSAPGAGVGMTIDTVPCTLTPAGGDIETGIDEAVQAAVSAAPATTPTVDPTAAPTDTATISASAVTAPSTPQTAAAPQTAVATASAVPTGGSDVVAPPASVATPVEVVSVQTGLVETGPVQTGQIQAGSVQVGPVQAGPVQAGPVQAGPVHADETSELTLDATVSTAPPPSVIDGAAMRARLARAARQAGGMSTATIDPVRAQARADLQAALFAVRGGEATVAAPAEATGQSTATPAARGVEQARANGKTTKIEQGSGVVAAAGLAVAAANEASGSTRQFGEQDGADSQGSARMAPAAAAVRAEATAPVFSLSAEPTATAAVTGGEGVGDVSPALTGITAAESARNVHAVVRSMRLQFLGGGGEAVLRLDPEHLGQVTLTVRVDQGRVAAHIQAETADASRWIETHQDELRSALEEQGLEVKELVVTTDPDGRREREQPRDPFRPRARRRTDDGATLPTFEVVA